MLHRRVVFFSRRNSALSEFVDDVHASGGRVECGEDIEVELGQVGLSIAHSQSTEEVLRHLDSEYVSLLLVDLRSQGDEAAFRSNTSAVFSLLSRLDEAKDIEARFGFHRIVALVSDQDGPGVDCVILELGGRGVRRIVRERAPCIESGQLRFGAQVVSEIGRIIENRRVGRTALCLSGGGTTGIYFELGALKCLSDCLPSGSLQNFDMIFGISAGAVVGSTLAAGYSVDEFMAAIAGVEGSRMPRLDFRIARLSNLNWLDAVDRVRRAINFGVHSLTRNLPSSSKQIRERGRPFGEVFADLFVPFFQLHRLESTLAHVFEIAGIRDRFDDLDTELFIGTSDQDRREHVIFGDEQHRDAPISRAVRASAAFSPAFAAVEIDGRYYEDGAVTRTSNFGEAVRRDATLVLIFDPFLPHVSREIGAAARRSVLYQVDQVIRTMSFTRFEQARANLIRQHPEVSFYTFLPSNRLRHLLSENPLDDRRYLDIWRGAYLSTHARLMRLGHRMKGDFAAHGLHLNFERANVVAEQLRRTDSPRFEDFYPNRKVHIPLPLRAKESAQGILEGTPQAA